MNCKRVIGLFLALLILVSNIGFSFTMHYCGGKVASISVQTLESNSIGKKGCCANKVVEKDSCCKNKSIQIEKKTDHATLKVFSFEPIVIYVLNDFKQQKTARRVTFISTPTTTYYCDSHAPPLFKLYHQYIYYA